MIQIRCPICGIRDHSEFAYGGDAAPARPASDAEEAAWVEYVYSRENPRGPHRELWHHAFGCRSWIVVQRDTLTHEISGTQLASQRSGR